MQANWIHELLLEGMLEYKNGRWISKDITSSQVAWSFSSEWKSHLDTGQQKTWDMTAAQRLECFYGETKTNPAELTGKIVLDTGCGTGQLTEAIAAAGARTIGIDRQPHLPDGNASCQFIQGDFDQPPLKPAGFDIVIANGSIHHTPDTRLSFNAISSLVKPGGKLYVFVYRKQRGWKRIQLFFLDFARFFISRMGPGLQRFFVNMLTTFFYGLSRIRKGENSSRSKPEIRINIYDAFTPRYRFYHDQEEISHWFAENGFDKMEVTLAGNAYGFGMLGIRELSNH